MILKIFQINLHSLNCFEYNYKSIDSFYAWQIYDVKNSKRISKVYNSRYRLFAYWKNFFYHILSIYFDLKPKYWVRTKLNSVDYRPHIHDVSGVLLRPHLGRLPISDH